MSGFEELGVEITHHFVSDEVYSKRTHIPAGLKLTQHIHPYDHASALISGTVLLEVDGVGREVTGPSMLMIEAGKAHSVTALTNAVWHCMHITAETDCESVDESILAGR